MYGLCFQIASLLFLSIIITIYFGKKNIPTVETSIFSSILITNFFGVIIDITSTALNAFGRDGFLLIFSSKMYLIYLCSISLMYIAYTIYISFKIKNIKKMIWIFVAIFIFEIIMIYVLPIYCYSDKNIVYTYGPATDFIKISGFGTYFLIMLLIMFRVKYIDYKKTIPLIGLVLYGFIASALQALFPELLLITMGMCLVSVLMYFTIENPDMKMIENLSASKQKAENSNNEKALFLFDTVQRLKNPVKSIEEETEELLNLENINEIKEGIRAINSASKSITSTINGFLGVNISQAHNIEVRNEDYDVNRLFTGIIAHAKPIIEKKGLELRYVEDPNLPKVLNGDSIRIKQIITTLINNSIKFTENGYIEVNISAVLKYDIYRLVITIEDSGVGINQEKLNELLDNNNSMELDGKPKMTEDDESIINCKLLASLIGGTIFATSEENRGTKFTVVIDQKRVFEDRTKTDKIIEEYEQSIEKDGTVFLIVDNEEESEKYQKYLEKSNYDIRHMKYGAEALVAVRKKEKCDLIIMSDDLKKITSHDTLKKLKELDGFRIPVVIIGNKKSDIYQNYNTFGYKDHIKKPATKRELLSIIKKYTN